MTKVNTFAAKLAVAFVATAMLFTMFAPATQAQTVEELQAQIATLMSQINALTAGDDDSSSSTVCPYTWTRTLNTGATGADVKMLQMFLNSADDTQVALEGNAGSPGMETSYYGPATGAAVAKFQEKHRMDVLAPLGLVNSTTFFGPSTMSKANAVCATAPVVDEDDDDATDDDDDSSDSAPLSGGEGTLLVDTLLDGSTIIDLGDAENVIEVEVEAQDSDIEVNRVDFTFDERPWLYFDEVNLMVDGSEVASLSGSGDFTELTGGSYRARFSGLDLVLREDDTAEVALELVTLGSLAGTRVDDTVTVTHPENGIRFVDAAGLSDYAPDTAITATVAFDESFGDGEISLTIGDNSPENATIVLNETSRTSDIAILEFDVEADDSDMEVTDVDVTFSTVGSTTAESLYRARLYVGTTLLSTETVGANTVAFDDLDYMIDENDTETFRVEVEFNDGDSIAISEITVGDVDVTAENADYVSATETLTVNEAHTVIVSGLVAQVVEIVESTQGSDNEVGRFEFTFDLTAYEDTFYVASDGSELAVSTSTNSATGDVSVTFNSAATEVAAGTAYRISKGATETFTATVFVTNVNDAAVQVILDTLDYWTDEALTTGGDTLDLGAPEFRSAAEFVAAGV